MRSLLLLVAGIWMLAGQAVSLEEEGPVTNFRVYQALSAGIGDTLGALIPAEDSVRVLFSVEPEGNAWIVEGNIVRALQRQGFTVVTALPAAFQLDLGIQEMHVAYADIRRDGFFGAKVVDREVTLGLGVRLVDHRSGIVLASREIKRTMRDLVSVSEIPTLEDLNVPVTRGTLPAEGFFSSLAEPLIMVGAVAVAVYLLFTVRS
jgi:hypothetical protein